MELALRKGRIQIYRASYYNDGRFLASVQDNETSGCFIYRHSAKGSLEIVDRNFRADICVGDYDIELPVVCRDYFLFSLCDHISHRLLTDFEADAAPMIDPGLFNQRVISNFLARHPDCEPLHDAVTYYDPYRDYKKVREPEMCKHFGYAYQSEVQIAFRAKQHFEALHPRLS